MKIEKPTFRTIKKLQGGEYKESWHQDAIDEWFTTNVEPINKILSEGVEVAGYGVAHRIWQDERYHDEGVTHNALLINIQPIKKESAEDLLKYIVNNWEGDELLDDVYDRAKAVLNKEKK